MNPSDDHATYQSCFRCEASTFQHYDAYSIRDSLDGNASVCVDRLLATHSHNIFDCHGIACDVSTSDPSHASCDHDSLDGYALLVLVASERLTGIIQSMLMKVLAMTQCLLP